MAESDVERPPAVAAGLRVAVLVKQVPRAESLELSADGRLVREGVELDMNAYCRRALAKGVELAAATGGSCTVFTLGPPSADGVLREALAWGLSRGLHGAVRGVHLCDPAFAGSDTLATARALAAAVSMRGPFDLVLTGRNSVDADTGQVGPEVAELLDMPFAAAVRELAVLQTAAGPVAEVSCERDRGRRRLRLTLPAVLSAAERLCDPAKVEPEGHEAVDPSLIDRISAPQLGQGPWGGEGSPTSVGPTRLLEVNRKRLLLSGPPPLQARSAVDLLDQWGLLERAGIRGAGSRVAATRGAGQRARPGSEAAGRHPPVEPPPAHPGDPPALVAVVEEPGHEGITGHLLREASRVASQVAGRVLRIRFGHPTGAGAPTTAVSPVEEDLAPALASWCEQVAPWALLLPATLFGREVASRVAARLGAGLTGDAVDLDTEAGRLVCWKPAFGGRMVAAITSSSPVQIATLRPGILEPAGPDLPAGSDPELQVDLEVLQFHARGRVQVLGEDHHDDAAGLLSSRVVVAVGQGVDPDHLGEIDQLVKLLGAQWAATRKVTDRGWMPRSRQVGLTGHSLAPVIYLAIGVSGKFNHMVGTRAAACVVAVNSDPAAAVFDWADIGLVGDWREIVPCLTDQLARL